MPSPADTSQNAKGPTREYPAAVLHLDCGPLQFADAPPGAERVPVEMLIRSNEGVERWGETWYHDFAGMRHKERVPIDYRHDGDQVIGYLDTFQVKRDGIHASGFVIPVEGDELTQRTITRAQAGVPYESSIYFGGNALRIEEVSANAKSQVNGRTVQGPAVIFREWPLRGVAICPYGADNQTRTKLDDDATISIPVIQTENSMSDQKPPGDEPLTKRGFFEALARALGFKSDDPPQETEGDGLGDAPPPEKKQEARQKSEAKREPPETPKAQAAPADRADLKRYLDAFGDVGGRWYAEGLSFEAAQAKHAEALAAENAELKKRLEAVDRGEEHPAEFAGEDDGDDKRVLEFARRMTPGTARFAASIKLPGRNNR